MENRCSVTLTILSVFWCCPKCFSRDRTNLYLVDIEVRNWLSKEVDVEVGVLDIVGGQSIVDLGDSNTNDSQRLLVLPEMFLTRQNKPILL
jgi:hypothetical protein